MSTQDRPLPTRPDRRRPPTWWERHTYRSMHRPIRLWVVLVLVVVAAVLLGVTVALLRLPMPVVFALQAVVTFVFVVVFVPRVITPPPDAPIRSVDLAGFVAISRALRRANRGRGSTLPPTLRSVALDQVERAGQESRWAWWGLAAMAVLGLVLAGCMFSTGATGLGIGGLGGSALLLWVIVLARRAKQRRAGMPELLRSDHDATAGDPTPP